MKPNPINKKRLVKTFVELVKIPSLSKKEGKFARYLSKELKKLGCKVTFDDANKKFAGEVGNLIAGFPGTIKSGPILLAAHLDTVAPGTGIKPQVSKTKITSDGRTILGADCKAGIAVILEILHILKEKKLPHPPVEILVSAAEELGLFGSKYLSFKKLKSRWGISLDNEDIHRVETKSSKMAIMEITVTGKSAHSGIEPEKGISAIAIAAKAISQLKLGRIDKETVCNINLMQAGTAINTIAPNAVLKGDIRSHSPKKLDYQIKKVKLAFEKSARDFAKKIDKKIYRPKIKTKIIPVTPLLDIPKNSYIMKLLKNSFEKNKVKLKITSSCAGSDANLLFSHGITAPLVGAGVGKLHTTKEYLVLSEFFKCAEIVLDVVLEFKD